MINLYKSVLILDSQSAFYKKKVDLLVKNGTLAEIGENIPVPPKASLIEDKGLVFFPGLIDLRVHNTLPGGEHRENWESLAKSAKMGGVFTLQLLPTGHPTPQTAESIQFVAETGHKHGLQFVPMAPLTLDNKGENFADLFDLHAAGAKGFSHGDGSLQNTDLFAKCLQYLMTEPTKVYAQPNTNSLSLYGQIHEGLQSTLTGLKGIPSLAETLAIKRDLDLLKYAISNSFGNLNPNFGLHFYCISAKESVELLKTAKQEDLPVTCSVAAHHLVFNEDAISDFDTNCKVFPPFRTEEDRLALVNGILEGTIDAIVSDHLPLEVELKEVEFDHASFGAIGLQTILQASLQSFKSAEYAKVAAALIDGPRKILGLNPTVSLEVGKSIFGTIVNVSKETRFEENHILSLSKNSPFVGFTFKTKIESIFHVS